MDSPIDIPLIFYHLFSTSTIYFLLAVIILTKLKKIKTCNRKRCFKAFFIEGYGDISIQSKIGRRMPEVLNVAGLEK